MPVPPDGSLKIISNSNLDSFSNVMIIKIPDEIKSPSELSYQLASIDPSKDDVLWPANKYIENLIPGYKKSEERKNECDNSKDEHFSMPQTENHEEVSQERSYSPCSNFSSYSFRKKNPYHPSGYKLREKWKRNRNRYSVPTYWNKKNRNIDNIEPWLDKSQILPFTYGRQPNNSYAEWNPSQCQNPDRTAFNNNVGTGPNCDNKQYSNLNGMPKRFQRGLLGDRPEYPNSFPNNYPHFSKNKSQESWNNRRNMDSNFRKRFHRNSQFPNVSNNFYERKYKTQNNMGRNYNMEQQRLPDNPVNEPQNMQMPQNTFKMPAWHQGTSEHVQRGKRGRRRIYRGGPRNNF